MRRGRRDEFLSFHDAAAGRVAGGYPADGAVGRRSSHLGRGGQSWVTVAFTWNGLRALGVDAASLATFPEEFKQGMVARAEMLGDTGATTRTTGSEAWPARTCTRS